VRMCEVKALSGCCEKLNRSQLHVICMKDTGFCLLAVVTVYLDTCSFVFVSLLLYWIPLLSKNF
jgi:hypothetical protein